MTLSPEQLKEALQLVSTAPAPGLKFAFTRSRSAGVPILWEEVISLELGGKAAYSTLRSFADAGGAPIGIWDAPAESALVRSLAARLLETKFGELAAKPIAPGRGVTQWRCSTKEGEFTLSAGSGDPVERQMSQVDLEMRSIANDLTASRNGAALSCQLELSKHGSLITTQIYLVNEGKRDCQVQNPLKGVAAPNAFLRLELGPMPQSQPGVTGPGVAYTPLPLPENINFTAPWDQNVFVLQAGQKLPSPFKQELPAAHYASHFIRAVYSHYGTATVKPDLALVRGRAFSTEQQLKE